jgi:hypothetical protein
VNKYLVLTYGRAGSVLLAEKIGRATNSLPVYVNQMTDLGDSLIQHSHLMFNRDQIGNFIKLFCLRKDPIQTILSLLIAKHYHQYHQFKNQQYNFVPFEYSDWYSLDTICDNYISYHISYLQQLNNSWAIIYYEDMLIRLPDIDQTYLPIYPDKEKILINYNQIVDYLAPWKEKLLDSQKLFSNVKNSIDIYSLLDSVTKE